MIMTEICPKHIRGRANVFLMFMNTCSTVVGAVLVSPQLLGTQGLWPDVFGIALAISGVHALGVLFIIRESPSYLMTKGREEKAYKSIEYYQGASADINQV